jgi:hypothetical protein
MPTKRIDVESIHGCTVNDGLWKLNVTVFPNVPDVKESILVELDFNQETQDEGNISGTYVTVNTNTLLLMADTLLRAYNEARNQPYRKIITTSSVPTLVRE